jgi:hypothetical protein
MTCIALTGVAGGAAAGSWSEQPAAKIVKDTKSRINNSLTCKDVTLNRKIFLSFVLLSLFGEIYL